MSHQFPPHPVVRPFVAHGLGGQVFLGHRGPFNGGTSMAGLAKMLAASEEVNIREE